MSTVNIFHETFQSKFLKFVYWTKRYKGNVVLILVCLIGWLVVVFFWGEWQVVVVVVVSGIFCESIHNHNYDYWWKFTFISILTVFSEGSLCYMIVLNILSDVSTYPYLHNHFTETIILRNKIHLFWLLNFALLGKPRK